MALSKGENMKFCALKLTFIAFALALSQFAYAAGKVVQIPFSEERVYSKDLKNCFYTVEINLGDMASAKPYQILRETAENHYDEIKYMHYVFINGNKELILKISSSSSLDVKSVCVSSQQVILLN
jgi:hypothetical protein